LAQLDLLRLNQQIAQWTETQIASLWMTIQQPINLARHQRFSLAKLWPVSLVT
jgi:hypothetical protein